MRVMLITGKGGIGGPDRQSRRGGAVSNAGGRHEVVLELASPSSIAQRSMSCAIMTSKEGVLDVRFGTRNE